MVEGLFLDGIRGYRRDITVDERVKFATDVFPRLAEAECILPDLASPFAEVTLHSFIRQFLE